MAILTVVVIAFLQLFMFGYFEKYVPFERPGPVPLHRGGYLSIHHFISFRASILDWNLDDIPIEIVDINNLTTYHSWHSLEHR